MAKDDYEVIVYQILAYLYHCLKKDIEIDVGYLSNEGKLYNINQKYHQYIFSHLFREGYIEGIEITKAWGEKQPNISNLEGAMITPKGIEYLTDKSFVKKAVALLKDTKGIIPFV